MGVSSFNSSINSAGIGYKIAQGSTDVTALNLNSFQTPAFHYELKMPQVEVKDLVLEDGTPVLGETLQQIASNPVIEPIVELVKPITEIVYAMHENLLSNNQIEQLNFNNIGESISITALENVGASGIESFVSSAFDTINEILQIGSGGISKVMPSPIGSNNTGTSSGLDIEGLSNMPNGGANVNIVPMSSELGTGFTFEGLSNMPNSGAGSSVVSFDANKMMSPIVEGINSVSKPNS